MIAAAGLRAHVLVFAWLVGVSLACATNPAHATVSISNKPTKNMSCSASLCKPLKKFAVLNVTDLANMLSTSSVKVVSDSSALDIVFQAPLTWTNTNRLTLDSYRSIRFQRPVAVAGAGAMTLISDDGGMDGTISFLDNGAIDFWDLSSNLIINGQRYILVSSIKDLAAYISSHPGCHCALAKNYNAKPDGIYLSAPIATTSWHGVFQGLGNTIFNLSIDAANGEPLRVGLFARGVGAAYTSFNLKNVTIRTHQTPRYADIGAIVGEDPAGTIFNANVEGTVDVMGAQEAGYIGGMAGYIGSIISSSGYVNVRVSGQGGAAVGGLTGAIFTSILASQETGNLSGENNDANNSSVFGGLVGSASQGVINDSHASGEVIVVGTGAGAVGGLIGAFGNGYSANASMLNSYSEEVVSAKDDVAVGGLIGISNLGTIAQSFASGEVSGSADALVGGLVGRDAGSTMISNSYSTASITVNSNNELSSAGGLIALRDESSAIVTASYSVGPISLQGSGTTTAGGFLGYDYGAGGLSLDYWDVDASGIGQGCGTGSCAGVTGLTDAQLKSGLPAGFDPAIWGQDPSVNNGYPYLLANPSAN